MLLAVSPRSARADVVYTYTGNDFTSATTPYTLSDYVTAELTFATPLAADMTLQIVTPLSFAFSDGVQTITPANTAGDIFELATNPSGMVTAWYIAAESLGDTDEITSGHDPSGTADTAKDVTATARNDNDPGTWSSVPEPSSLAIVAAAMTVLGWRRRRRPVRLPDPE